MTSLGQSEQMCSFDVGETHTNRLFFSECIQNVPLLKSRPRKCNLNASHATLHFFGAKCKWEHFKRDKSTSRDFVARSAAARPKKLAPFAWKLVRSTCGKSNCMHDRIVYCFVDQNVIRSAIEYIDDLYEYIDINIIECNDDDTDNNVDVSDTE